MKLPIYECPNFTSLASMASQRPPVNIINVKWYESEDSYEKERYPDGYIVIFARDARNFDYSVKLKCYISKKGRYAIYGKHRFYEGYSGAIILRNLPPWERYDIVRNAAKQYGTIVED